MKKVLLAIGAILVIAVAGLCFWLDRHYVVPILMYHSVANAAVPSNNTVTPEEFEKQIGYLKEHAYRVITLDELVAEISQGRRSARNTVVITFDDGYADNYRNAYPILKKFGFPATIFVIADSIDKEGYLTLEQMKEMEAGGLNFGSHSRKHAYLPDLNKVQLLDEVAGSKLILEEKLGHKVGTLSYPSGGYTPEVKALARAAGYQGAVTTNRGEDKLNRDVFALKRVKFVNKSSRWPTIWIQLSGYYNLFRESKNPD